MSEVNVIRRILHCDMDCFYAAVHMRDDPSLAGKPVVIGGNPEGRGVVAAASYEARRFGIRSALPAARAVRLCPQAVFIRPDFNRYREESDYIVEIFRDFTPIVQKVSIDEAYLDVTEQLEPWGSATAVAQEIKRRIRQERGLTVSVGVGPNRLVAKIASDFDKPDGLTVVKPPRVQAFLDVLSVRTLPGVGPASEKRLREQGDRDDCRAAGGFQGSAEGSLRQARWLALQLRERHRRASGPNPPGTQEPQLRANLRRGPAASRGNGPGARTHGRAGEPRTEETRAVCPDRDDQGSVRRLHDFDAIAHLAKPDVRRTGDGDLGLPALAKDRGRPAQRSTPGPRCRKPRKRRGVTAGAVLIEVRRAPWGPGSWC